jgi:hypothetical protein
MLQVSGSLDHLALDRVRELRQEANGLRRLRAATAVTPAASASGPSSCRVTATPPAQRVRRAFAWLVRRTPAGTGPALRRSAVTDRCCPAGGGGCALSTGAR